MQDFLQGFQAGAPGILPMLKEPALLEACGILFQDGKDKDAVLFRKGEDLWQEGAAFDTGSAFSARSSSVSSARLTNGAIPSLSFG